MSLIGSLEDLALGDLLQIIHLSQKSGLLTIRGPEGEGRIVLQDGMVRRANLKGDPEDLRGLLVDRGIVSAENFESASESARNSGAELSSVLSKLASVAPERIDSLRRECIENAVAEMFSWESGEFSFDVGAQAEFLSGDMALSVGLNAQYLAMESLRVRDERASSEPATARSDDVAGTNLNLELSAEEMFGVLDGSGADSMSAVDALVEGTTEQLDRMREAQAEPEPCADVVSPETAVVEQVKPEATISPEKLPPVVVIDDHLPVLEWVRHSLATDFANVHIFQRSQEGLGRIRQYLARAQTPILLVSPKIEGNPMNGIVDATDFVKRLQDQAPRMLIFWLLAEHEEEPSSLPLVLPTVVHPSLAGLADPNSPLGLQGLAQRIAASLIEHTSQNAGRKH